MRDFGIIVRMAIRFSVHEVLLDSEFCDVACSEMTLCDRCWHFASAQQSGRAERGPRGDFRPVRADSTPASAPAHPR